MVTGVDELNENIYVVVDRSDRVKVFGKPPLYNRFEVIAVPEMEDPIDMTANLATGNIFVAD